ncbi:MAG: hypothetical protein WBV82_18630 [Myxococcaceae bacterium]
MPFELERFTRQLLAETLFFDEETGAFGGVTLVDEDNGKEVYFASFEPDSEAYVIEKATEWEKIDTDGDGEPDFEMGTDGTEHGTYPTAEDAAEALLALSREQNLSPNVMLHMDLGEDEDTIAEA